MRVEPPDGRRLICMGLDDISMMRRVQAQIFKRMGAKAENTVVHGGSKAEMDGFVALVLERRPHVVLLDQNIDHDGMPHLLGSDVAAEIQQGGGVGTGVVCILTGTADAKLEGLRATPGVDCAFSKGMPPVLLCAELRKTYQAKWEAMCRAVVAPEGQQQLSSATPNSPQEARGGSTPLPCPKR